MCGEFVDLGERVEWRVPVRGIAETSLGPRAFDLDAPAHQLDVVSFLGGPTDPSSQTWYSAGDRLVVE